MSRYLTCSKSLSTAVCEASWRSDVQKESLIQSWYQMRTSNLDGGKQCLFVGCLTSQQHASVSQGRICSDNFTCCHTEIEVADQTFYLIQSQYTDTGPTSPSADPITPGVWQGSHWSANFWVTGMTQTRKNPRASGIRTRIFRSRGGRLTTGQRGGRRGKTRHAVNTVKSVWRPANVTTRKKLSIFKSSVKAVLLYGCETWHGKVALFNML